MKYGWLAGDVLLTFYELSSRQVLIDIFPIYVLRLLLRSRSKAGFISVVMMLSLLIASAVNVDVNIYVDIDPYRFLPSQWRFLVELIRRAAAAA